jgi:PleD family two-component response regulator
MLAPEKDIIFQYCNDPTAALHVANQFAPTVILQDLVMPDIDGLMLVRFFRANAATRDMPLIVLSTKEEPKTKAEAFALGANDYLVKLPDKLELLARIRYHSTGVGLRGYVARDRSKYAGGREAGGRCQGGGQAHHYLQRAGHWRQI